MARWYDIAAPAGEALAGYGEIGAAKNIARNQAEKEAFDRAELERQTRRQQFLDESLIKSRTSEEILRSANLQKVIQGQDEETRRRAFLAQLRKSGDPKNARLADAMEFNLPNTYWEPKPSKIEHRDNPDTGEREFYEPETQKIVGKLPPPTGYRSPSDRKVRDTMAVFRAKDAYKKEQIKNFIKDIPDPEMRERAKRTYDTYGVLPKVKSIPATVAADWGRLDTATRDAYHVADLLTKFEKTVAADPKKYNDIASRFGAFVSGTAYTAGLSPSENKLFSQLTAAMSRFGVESAGMISRASGGRLSAQVIRLIDPHIPDMKTQSLAAVKDRLQQLVIGLEASNRSMADTLGKFYDAGRDIDESLKNIQGSLEGYGETGTLTPVGTTIDLDTPPQGTGH